ncbi:MAG: hypothetical protein JW769_01160 [Parachlamydiales bacterium]|nr:hypothetical protein [Parachlamydiales bacterium]
MKYECSLSFTDLIKNYAKLQSDVVAKVKQLASSICQASPGKFLLVQFMMSQVTQMGDSISNMIAQVNSVINNAVRNQKST